VAFSEYDSELVLYVTEVSSAHAAAALKRSSSSSSSSALNLTLLSAKAQAWAAFVNGELVGTGEELSHSGGSAELSLSLNVTSAALSAGGSLTLSLLSSSLGIDNGGGVHNGSSTGVKGITSTAPRSVLLSGVDITSAAPWTQVVGSVGEAKAVYTAAGGAAVPWTAAGSSLSTPPLTWLKASFTAPASVLPPPPGVEVSATLNLDVTGLSRGRFFVNGMDLGRYWSRLCGSSSMCQRFYSIPLDLLLPGEGANTLVLLDELGASNISAVALAVSANTAPPPPPPCGAPPASGGPAGAYPCGSTSTLWLQGPGAGGGSQLALSSVPSLCLAAAAAGQVLLEPCNSSSLLQAWALPQQGSSSSVTSLASAHASGCLDVFKQNSSVGAPLDIYNCHGGSNQRWTWSGKELVSALTGTLCAGLCIY